MIFEPDTAQLRTICHGSREVIRGIYAAVRDRNWGTLPSRVTRVSSDIQPEEFQIDFDVVCQEGDIHFAWHGLVSGTPAGEIHFEFHGEARSSFFRNRIGCCVLHPLRECAGARAWCRHPDGSREDRRFPDLIEPQIFGRAPFSDLQILAHEVVPELWAELAFEGDVFEMEDQRNWTDASFKTYCTPLARPFPVPIEEGTRIDQRVALRLSSARLASSPVVQTALVSGGPPSPCPLGIQILNRDQTAMSPLPELGLCLPSRPSPLSQAERSALEALHLAHVRLDLRVQDPGWKEALRCALEQPIARSLELALHLPQRLEQTPWVQLRDALQHSSVPLARILLLRKGEAATSPETLRSAQAHLAGFPLGVGTDANFCELNRARALGQFAGATFVSWPITPQVHAFDNRSILENLEAQPCTVETARTFAPGLPLCISPVTLKPRFNAVATAADDSATKSDCLPAHVDVRQLSWFGAAWTLGSLAQLTAAGVAAITYYETLGWAGVMEANGGSLLPALFPSRPGELFPLYHVFEAVAGFTHATPLDVGGFPGLVGLEVFRAGHPGRVILADASGAGAALQWCGPAAGGRLLGGASNGPSACQRVALNPDASFTIGPHELLVLDRFLSPLPG